MTLEGNGKKARVEKQTGIKGRRRTEGKEI